MQHVLQPRLYHCQMLALNHLSRSLSYRQSEFEAYRNLRWFQDLSENIRHDVQIDTNSE